MPQSEPVFMKILEQIRQPETMTEAQPTRTEWTTLVCTGLLGSAALGVACATYGMSLG